MSKWEKATESLTFSEQLSFEKQWTASVEKCTECHQAKDIVYYSRFKQRYEKKELTKVIRFINLR